MAMVISFMIVTLSYCVIVTKADLNPTQLKSLCHTALANNECRWLINSTDGGPNQRISSQHNSYSEMVAYGKCALRYLNLRFYENNQATSSVDSDIKSPDHLGQEIFQYLQEPPGVWGIQDENFINVKIDGTNIKRIYENYRTQRMYVEAVMRVSWKDTRLKWNDVICLKRKYFLFGADDIGAHVGAEFWRPNFKSYEDIDFSWHHIRIDNSGNVMGRVRVVTPMTCTYDYTKYPFDVVECHYYLTPEFDFVHLESESPEKLQRDVMRSEILIPPEWSIESITENQLVYGVISSNYDQFEYLLPQISLAFTFKRRSQLAYKIAIILLATAVALGMFGPLSGSIKGVCTTKLLSIATSIAGVTILALHNTRLYHSKVTPRIIIAFEFNFALTTLSFLLILIQYQMAIAVAENLPSPHQFKFVFDFINRFLFWIPKFEYGGTKVQHSTEVSETAENAMTKNFTHDWLAINEAVHRLLFIFFLFTYLIGTIILVSF